MAESAVEKIESFRKFGSVLGLGRMTVLMEKLGNPEKRLKAVHVAGTNGKGSVARYIYETLLASGYRAGLYISPYIEKFNERIELSGEMISDDDLASYTDTVLEKVTEMTEEGEESPTEFEVITAVAFLYFAEKGCDAAVIEVGLGGRGDSTNVITPVLSVITSISYDHMDRLGSTIREIAGEKAGIIKEGVPVIVSTEREDALRVFEKKAEETSSELIDVRKLAKAVIKEMTPEGTILDVSTGGIGRFGEIKDLRISMPGRHQAENALEAVSALSYLSGKGEFDIDEHALRKGLGEAKQPGRFEVLASPENGESPYVVLDGAHNEDGVKRLTETMDILFPEKKVLVVTGILSDKDAEGMLKGLSATADTFIATEPPEERKLPAKDLAEMIHGMGFSVYEIPKPRDAVALAMSVGKGYDVILFCGSLYLIGEVRTLLRTKYLRPGENWFKKAEREDGLSAVIIENDEDD